ncbi:hypothetical protein D3C86_1569450 [compost metagenome]
MGRQIGAALQAFGVQARRRQCVEAARQGGGVLGQLGQGARMGLGRLGPFGRAVIGVDIARLALADLQRQGDVVTGHGVQTIRRRRRRRGAGGQQDDGGRQGGDVGNAHGNSLSPVETLGLCGLRAKKATRSRFRD